MSAGNFVLLPSFWAATFQTARQNKWNLYLFIEAKTLTRVNSGKSASCWSVPGYIKRDQCPWTAEKTEERQGLNRNQGHSFRHCHHQRRQTFPKEQVLEKLSSLQYHWKKMSRGRFHFAEICFHWLYFSSNCKPNNYFLYPPHLQPDKGVLGTDSWDDFSLIAVIKF